MLGTRVIGLSYEGIRLESIAAVGAGVLFRLASCATGRIVQLSMSPPRKT